MTGNNRSTVIGTCGHRSGADLVTAKLPTVGLKHKKTVYVC